MAAEAAALAVEAQEGVGDMEKNEQITVLGPTASGKTAFAARLAYALDGEIISADSRQIYRLMDIGTGKDLSEYTVEGVSIPYHLIDIRKPGDKYTLFDYQHDYHKAYQTVAQHNKTPILCGGTGLYIESVLKGYHLPDVPANPTLRAALEEKSLQELTALLQSYRPLHNSTDTDSKKRAIRAIEIEVFKANEVAGNTSFPPIDSTILGLDIDRQLRREKITSRLKARLQEGMIDEIRGILNSGVSAEDLIYYGLEYKFVTLHVTGELSYEEMFRQLEIAIHQFAKRQMTWFRGMERRGFTIHWIDAALPIDEKVQLALGFIN